MIKVLITGAQGQLGQELAIHLKQEPFEVFGYGRERFDITNQAQVNQVVDEIKPDIIVHCAAYTKVDDAEKEQDLAFLINAIGTRNIAISSEKYGSKLVYFSTDYVFNGEENKPYTEFDNTNPLGVYGKSKLAGEHFVRDFHSKFFIVRTSWVFGKYGNNFVKTMLRLGQEKEQISVVNDPIGCPTYTLDLAKFIIQLIQTEKYGIYHVSNSGNCSWYEFAKEIFRISGLPTSVVPITTEQFPRPAPRPKYSVFEHLALRLNGFPELRKWEDALADFLKGFKTEK
jgi:dTDP-4-dehydrorhamnose reductase